MNRLILNLFVKRKCLPSSRLLIFSNSKLIHCRFLATAPPNSNHEPPNKIDESNNGRILTIPNLLTLSRISSIPFINYFIFVEEHKLACGLFLAAAITDFLDGYIARRFPSQSSQLGSILDPLADKLLIGSLAITLGCTHMLPMPLVALILVRDAALIAASLYIRYTLVDKPVTLRKFVDVGKHAPVQVRADLISKFNTFVQLSLITVTLPSALFAYQDAAFLIALQYLTALTTIASSVSYLYKRGSYKVIDKPNKPK